MKRKTKGIVLIILPPALLVFSLVAFAVSKFVITSIATTAGGGDIQITAAIVRLILSGLGILSVIGFFTAIPFGFYLLSKKDPEHGSRVLAQNPDRYHGLTPEQVSYVHGFSVAAFFGGFIWALGNKLYLWALGFLVPIFGVYVWLKLAFHGRRMAYEKGWSGFDEFKKRQKVMAWVIAVLLVVSIALNIFQ